VQDAIDTIESGTLQKVVLSRTKEVALKGEKLFPLFTQLISCYSTAFSYLFGSPSFGTWVGATPETLIKVDQNQILSTMALAGTQTLEGTSPKEAVWRQKEIEEQAYVSRHIINCLKKIRVREFEEIGPRTVQSGNLLHLRTTYNIDLKEVSYPQLGGVMMDLLQPTSAVCGMPMEHSLNFILNTETHSRSLYSGFLGPINYHGESHVFVNLRCGKFDGEAIRLYAGAGITLDSDPEREWVETELKCDTLLSAIHQI
jgi:isochorismate synthase